MNYFICAYDTVKYVHIKDARLGLLRSLFLVGIIAYVVIFEMLGQGGWLESASIVGVVRFSLQQPTKNNCDPSSDRCTNAFSALTTLPYCTQFSNTSTQYYYPGSTYPCEIYEAINAQIVNERSIVVITRGSLKNQTLVCGSSSENSDKYYCPSTYNDTTLEYKFYTAQSEAFTILLDHAVTASKICSTTSRHQLSRYACASESSNYQGLLLSKSDALCEMEYRKNQQTTTSKSYQLNNSKEIGRAPCYIQPNRTDTNQDFFSLYVLLQAAGVDLDDCNPNGVTTLSSCQTYRDTGATLLLSIDWSDFRPYQGLVQPYYYYSPQFIVGSSFKQYIPFYESYRSSRTLLNAHGVKLAILMSGEFHQFNIVAFMITLTTALGLLAVATTIVDMCMLYVLPNKKRYQNAKYEQHRDEFDGAVLSVVAPLNQSVQDHSDDFDHETNEDVNPGIFTPGASFDQGMNEPLLWF